MSGSGRDPWQSAATLRWLVFGLVVATLAIVGLFAAGEIGRGRAIAATESRATDSGTLARAILRGEME